MMMYDQNFTQCLLFYSSRYKCKAVPKGCTVWHVMNTEHGKILR